MIIYLELLKERCINVVNEDVIIAGMIDYELNSLQNVRKPTNRS